MLPTAYIFSEVLITHDNGEKEEVFCLEDGRGEVLDSETAKKYLYKALRFYENEEIEEFIKNINIRRRLSTSLFPYDEEKDIFFLKEPYLEEKEVRKDIKRHWGFTCPWCGEKWSSKKSNIYYSAYFDEFHNLKGLNDETTVCSKECGHAFVKDDQKQYLHERGLLKYFDV